MPAIAVLGTTEDSLCVAIIMQKDIKATGKTVQNADNLSRQRCTYGMGQMNTILRCLRTHLLMSPQNVLDVGLP